MLVINALGKRVAFIEHPGHLELFWTLPALSRGIYTIQCQFHNMVSAKKLMVSRLR